MGAVMAYGAYLPQEESIMATSVAVVCSDRLSNPGQRVIVEPGLDKYLLLRKFEIGNGDLPIEAQRLYIIDPLGNLMMSYPPDINPRGIMKDLKKLLKFSRIG